MTIEVKQYFLFMNPGQNVDGQNVDGEKKNRVNDLLFNKKYCCHSYFITDCPLLINSQ